MQAAKVKSNQFLFLNISSVSWWQWHPISIAGVVPGADNLSQDVTLHLKAYGHWSRVSNPKICRPNRFYLVCAVKQCLCSFAKHQTKFGSI